MNRDPEMSNDTETSRYNKVTYDTQGEYERGRLDFQAESILESDKAYITTILNRKIASFGYDAAAPHTINIIEHGGSTLKPRIPIFDMISNNYPNISFNYINFEYNQEAVANANELANQIHYDNVNINSIQCDLNAENAGDVISNDLDQMGVSGADVVLSNYVIQHLSSPEHCLQEMQKYTNEDCDVFMRCPEDDYKTINPDSGFSSPTARQAATNIVNLFTGNLPDDSDRHLGKRLEGIANNVGYENDKTELFTQNIPGNASTEQKELYLIRDFRWYINVINDTAQENPQLVPIAIEMEENYQTLRNEFLQTDCSYIYQEPCVTFSAPKMQLQYAS